MREIIKKKLAKYPTEETIKHYYERAKQDYTEFPLTINEVRKMYWKAIKTNYSVNMERVYQKRLEKHIEYINKSKKAKVNFTPVLIGHVEITETGVVFICDEHNLMTAKPAKGKDVTADWIKSVLFQYETERCVNIIDNQIWTRLDLSK